jgi:hypothetical protein
MVTSEHAAPRAGSKERVVFTVLVAVIALHILVDGIVAPEPGTGANDHAVSTLVPLGTLCLAVWSYSLLRPGYRGVIALVLGLLSLIGCAPSIAHAASVAPRGDDWSGFLLLPAGLALCALGISLLWRSRKPGGRRFARRGLLAIAAVIGLYWVVLPAAVAIVVTHRPRDAAGSFDLGRPHEDVVVQSSDGLDLHGTYVASGNGAAVIVYPASESRAPQARMLARHGYGVLMLEMRGYGRSDGDPNAFGWGASKDIDAGVGFLRARPEVEAGRIGGIGFSVGGEQMLEAAAGNSDLQAVVSEGAGERSIRESRLRGPRGWPTLPRDAVETAAVAVLSGDMPPPSLRDLVARIAPRPILLIHASDGQGGEDLNPTYFEAARQPKTLWRIAGSSHTGGLAARPAQYERRVVGFFDRVLAAGAPRAES